MSDSKLAVVPDAAPAQALRPPVPPASLAHRELLGGEFWRRIPAYANVSEAEFLDHKWQAKSSITNIGKLLAALEGLVSEGFIADAQRGFERAPMSVRVSPYLLSLIDWSDPERRSAAPAVHPAGLAAPARSPAPGPRLAARARGHAGARADPPLRRQGAVPRRSTPARSTAASARAATRSASTRKRSTKFQLKVNADRWAADVRLHRARAPSSRTSSSRAATPSSCGPSRSRRSARRCCRSITSGASATRPRGRR